MLQSESHLLQPTSEWDVALFMVQCSDALLECQQALVDLRPLHSRLLVIVVRVCAALAPRKINE